MNASPFADFSFDYLRRLLHAAQERFEVTPLREAHSDRSGPRLVLRHDLDVWLPAAVPMAEIEAGMGVRATYLVQVDSPMYRIDTPEARSVLNRLLELGHEVGLHLWVGDVLAGGDEEVDRRARAAGAQLAHVTGAAVESISFHRPDPILLRGPRTVGGMVSGYARELMGFYLSDSEGRWREGDPVPMLGRTPSPLAQVLTHPIWWGEGHRSAGDRLQDFFGAHTGGFSHDELEAFDAALDSAVFPARRSGRT